ncbi:MBL fold metallo-hydrolase [Jannaschia pagri]|uniref:MBL fold metallo-hydrolase n=1 Tax=Jannaschia pagri TaxID=2829797 RepID=A0ABQ4NJD8_9RHOB|nr:MULTISPECIES: MBL fold metallo-hydrolase [unclassified Jannaschia]GIT90693.1 MBL fold metallo-hydrolase [Jannaschia sp. AI_61]GIT94525.1 MBL fold metallo-hydrolase [Jannaschia sp. AI_62]
MRVTWFGQAALLFEGKQTSVMTDPFTPDVLGYPAITEAADIVLTSSDDDDAHCRSDLIAGHPVTCNTLDIAGDGKGTAEVGGLTVQAIAAEEWEHHPRGVANQNAMYRFTLDGIKIAHMGDVGNALTDEQIAFFEGVDVLCALTGGSPTIALPDLMRMIHMTAPKLVIPIHFRTLAYRPANIQWITDFLPYFNSRDVEFAFGPHAEIAANDLTGHTRVLVLDHKR